MTGVVLVVPPFTDPSQPGAAVPSLAAALAGTGARLTALDLNLDCWDYLLDPRRQRRWLAALSRRLDAFDRAGPLSPARCLEYTALADGWLRGRAALDELAGAMDVLRSTAFYDERAYRRAMNAVEGALAVVSATYHPAQLEWGRFFPARSTGSSRELVRAARATRASPFPAYVRARVGPLLARLRPALVGISITYLDQLVPAFAVAAECRRRLPGARIVLGGQIPSAWGEDLDDDVALWSVVDAVVCGDGEQPLRGLVAAIRGGRPFAGVPGVRVRGTPPVQAPRPPLSTLPCPDYGVLPLHRYLSPAPVLTVGASRGCYWGRCAFCAVSPAFRGQFRARPPAAVRADLEALAARHGVRHFFFADDALPRAVVRDLATGAPPAAPIRWQGELRWDGVREEEIAALAAAGARNLVFGFESGSTRTLESMRKGADLDRAERILARCREAGVGVNLQCFLGFPGETRADARATVQFLERVRGARVTVSCGLFELQKGSPVQERPETWGIRVRRPPRGEDLAVRYDYAPVPNQRWRRDLAKRIRERFAPAAPQLRCGIHAHALLWLSSERALRGMASAAPSAAPRGGISVRRFGRDPAAPRERAVAVLAYTLDRTSPLRIGEVAAAVLAAQRAGVPVEEMVRPLSAPERRRVRRLVRTLARSGLIEAPCASAPGPRPVTARIARHQVSDPPLADPSVSEGVEVRSAEERASAVDGRGSGEGAEGARAARTVLPR